MKSTSIPKRDNKHDAKSLVIPNPMLSRLPIYYSYVQEKLSAGDPFISAVTMAESLSLNPVQVRKDLASISSQPGRPRVGFATQRLLEDLSRHLGYDDFEEAILVGVGGLGHTLLQYPGFRAYGLNIVAGFDANPSVVGTHVGGKPVLPVGELEGIVRRQHISLGIITVPGPQAQQVADLLVEAGIRAIWNFAPAHIDIPAGVLIKNENLAASLAVLSLELQRQSSLF